MTLVVWKKTYKKEVPMQMPIPPWLYTDIYEEEGYDPYGVIRSDDETEKRAIQLMSAFIVELSRACEEASRNIRSPTRTTGINDTNTT